ncbi:hypothetical protein [Fictibacillus macauensis]|nr:hypothetical protein [Fictibacillus macauensis]
MLSWDKLTDDGCWGSFDLGSYSPEQLKKHFGPLLFPKEVKG